MAARAGYPFKRMAPGAQHRVPFELDNAHKVIDAAKAATMYYQKHFGITVAFKLDLEKSELIFTVTKNPMWTELKRELKAVKQARVTVDTTPKAAFTSGWSDVFGACDPIDRHTRMFFRDALLSACVMNEPERAHAIATEVTALYRASLTTLGKEKCDGA